MGGGTHEHPTGFERPTLGQQKRSFGMHWTIDPLLDQARSGEKPICDSIC